MRYFPVASTLRIVDAPEANGVDPLIDAERRLRLYSYLTMGESRTYFAIMRVFASTLMADLSAADVSNALASAERDGWIVEGESSIDRVLDRLDRLTKWGNLVPGRRETSARSIAEFSHGSMRYQISKLALRIHREAEAVLEIPLGAREVSRELLPAIQRGLDSIWSTVTSAIAAEYLDGLTSREEARIRERLAEQVTTLFLQHGELATTVRDFYAHVGQVVARHDLNPQEIAGFRVLLAEYIQLVVDDVLRYTVPISEGLARLQPCFRRCCGFSHRLRTWEVQSSVPGAAWRATGRVWPTGLWTGRVRPARWRLSGKRPPNRLGRCLPMSSGRRAGRGWRQVSARS